jgi:hypothetical protein
MPQPTRAPGGNTQAQNICPLCRSAALEFDAGSAICAECGATLAFDPATRRAKLTHIPEIYHEVTPALRGKWMSRAEMFAIVDAAYEQEEGEGGEEGAEALEVPTVPKVLKEPKGPDASDVVDAYDDDDDDDDDEIQDDDQTEVSGSERWRRLLPVTALSALLVFACLCTGLLTLGAGAVAITRRDVTPTTDVQALALAATQTALTATLSALNTAPPISVTVPVSSPVDATTVEPPTLTVQAPDPGAAPVQPAPPAQDTPVPPTPVPAVPTPVPTPNPLDSSLPTPNPPTPTLPPASTATVPATFTPAGAPGAVLTSTSTPTPVAGGTSTVTPSLQATPTLVVQGTIAPTATGTRTPTPSITPTPTATYAPGGFVLAGPLSVQTVRYQGTGQQFDEYVEIVNNSDQQVSLSGLELRYTIKGKAPNDPPEPFEFPNGAVILGRGVCRIYTFSPPAATGACENFNWNWANGNLWPDRVNDGTTVRLFNDRDQELARFTY